MLPDGFAVLGRLSLARFRDHGTWEFINHRLVLQEAQAGGAPGQSLRRSWTVKAPRPARLAMPAAPTRAKGERPQAPCRGRHQRPATSNAGRSRRCAGPERRRCFGAPGQGSASSTCLCGYRLCRRPCKKRDLRRHRNRAKNTGPGRFRGSPPLLASSSAASPGLAETENYRETSKPLSGQPRPCFMQLRSCSLCAVWQVAHEFSVGLSARLEEAGAGASKPQENCNDARRCQAPVSIAFL